MILIKIEIILTKSLMPKKKKEELNKQQLQDLKEIAAVLSDTFTIGKDNSIWQIKKKVKKVKNTQV